MSRSYKEEDERSLPDPDGFSAEAAEGVHRMGYAR